MAQKSWKVVLAGECMVCRPFAMHDDPRSMGVIDLLRDSDVTYGHLEMNLADYDELRWPARGQGLGSFVMAEPEVARDLKWAGFDIMSAAHNHSFDFGPEGILATRKHMKAAGIVTAGIGSDLELASEPGYIERKKGRVALVAASSGNPHYAWASLPKGALRGRPGVNPLRLDYEFTVDRQTAENLKDFARKLNVLVPKGTPERFGIALPGSQQGREADFFVVGDGFDITSRCHKRDLERNLRSIDEARTMADLVIVAHHFSASDGARGDIPPKFAEEFARAAIDAGADIYVGHGWHSTLGIEIYKGKPIIYGIGNFFAQSEFIQRVPYDSYEAWGHDMDRLPTLTPALHPLHPGLDTPSDTWWTSAILGVEIDDNAVKEVRLYPVETGRDATKDARQTRRTGSGDHPFTEGRPMIADAKNARLVLERYQRTSKRFGVDIGIEDGVGVIRL